MIDARSSNIFWELKAFAILTVFYAHLVWVGEPEGGRTIYESIGCIGVPLFMMTAGFFDAKSSTPLSIRAKNLFVPLLIWGTFSYCIKVILTPSITLLCHPVEWLKWILGCGTWFYFIPVLFFCQVMVRYLNIFVIGLLGIVSMILTFRDVIPYNEIITPYNNPFNLVLYFIIGRYYRLLNGDMINIPTIIVIPCLVFNALFLYFFQIPLYWNPLSLLYSMAMFCLLWILIRNFPLSKEVVHIGKISMVLYFCHMQIAQALATRVCSLLGGGIFGNVLKTPIVFLVVVGLVIMLEYLLRQTKQDTMLTWLGYK